MTLGVRLPNWLGDALTARRAIASLAAGRGEENLALAGPPGLVALLRPEHPRARWIETTRGFAAALKLGSAWRGLGISEVILLPNSLSSRLAGWRSGARERVGFAPRSGNQREWEAGLWLTRAVARGRRGDRHLEDEYLDLVAVAGGRPVAWRALRLPEGAAERALSLLAPLGGAPYIAVAPGARYGPARLWSAERFTTVARALCARAPDLRVVMVGEALDAEACARVTGLLGTPALDVAGRTDLVALAGVLAGASAVISNDSGAAHLAGALERPTVMVYGSSDPRWTAPRSPSVAALWYRVRCAPCFRRTCPWTDPYACLRIVEARDAVEALRVLGARSAA